MYKILYNSVVAEACGQMPENQPAQSNESFAETGLNALATAEKRSNRMILVGAPDWVRGVIQRLHHARIVEAGAWSKLLPTRQPDEVISVLQRSRSAK